MSGTNHWLDDKCAKAFWDQHKALPYQELLDDTVDWLEPQKGERWLDLGCGGGQLTAALWMTSAGTLGQIIAADCAAVNREAIAKLRRKLTPAPREDQIQFVQANFSNGLSSLRDSYFDGIVSGLAISYAESQDPLTGQYTDDGYNRLLGELHRVLKPGGRLVFSVNVPNPKFWRILWKSIRMAPRVSKPGKVLWNALKMQSYGRWLCKEARRGRFHFLPIESIVARLNLAGFLAIRHRTSYADQAYVVYAEKPVAMRYRVGERRSAGLAYA